MDKRFGGLEGRIKGGRVSQLRRRLNPELYRNLGCNISDDVSRLDHSNELAEIVGAILGDGGITNNQLKITVNSERDKEYSVYLTYVLKRLFCLNVGRFKVKNAKCYVLYLSSVGLIKRLKEIGLVVGNKVKLQVGVPSWIIDNLSYSRWCLRGLMDTDGGIFLDKYVVNGKRYCYKKVCFTNKSKPLIDFVYKTLIRFGFHPQVYSDNKVWLYSYKETDRYLLEIGSSNQRLNFFNSK